MNLPQHSVSCDETNVCWSYVLLYSPCMEFLKDYVFTVVQAYAVLTVVGQLIAVAVLVLLLMRSSLINRWVSPHALTLMLITALAATLGSLFFSDIAGWTPCKLCWWQRIFMYPQVVLLAIALWKRDVNVARYVLAFSLIGALIAVYHYYEQVSAALVPLDPSVPCDATGVSCASTQIHFTFGYITLPVMAFTVFVLNALGSVAMLREKR